ncbi:MAG: HEPN domain-containing protein [Planctomycetota bacterium]|nr:HEPN domain-containing protein [Planctomycetota bacterium]
MNPVTREWVSKAEGDFATASRELRARKSPNYDAACFHAQQCAEKYMKALLHAAGIPFARTHDLEALLDQVVAHEPAWEMLRPDLETLTTHAVAVRYPGWSTNRAVARGALVTAREVRRRARLHLRLRG